MNNEYVFYSGDELYHHGIKGMKWGIRRYQNKDGSLTAAGQKRRNKLQAKLDKLEGTEKMKNSGKNAKKIGDMTDEELSEYIARKNEEKMAYTLQRDIAQLNPKKVSAGQKFAENLKNDLAKNVSDAAGKAVKEMMNKAMEKALGKGADDALSKLKKEAEKAGYQQTISNAKKAAAEAMKAEREVNKKETKEDIELAAKERSAKLADYEKREQEARKAKLNADYQELVNESKRGDSSKTSTISKTSDAATSKTSSEVYDSFSKTHGTDSYSSFSKSTSSQQNSGKKFVDDMDDYLYNSLWAIGDDDD